MRFFSVAWYLLLNPPKYAEVPRPGEALHVCSGHEAAAAGEGNRQELCKSREEDECFAEITLGFSCSQLG